MGTNGYVQRNTAFIMKGKEDVKFKTEDDIRRLDAAANREPNQGILDHERKRKLEVKCMELEEVLEEQGYKDTEIEEKVSAYRKMLLNKEVSKKAFADVDELVDLCLKRLTRLLKHRKRRTNSSKKPLGLANTLLKAAVLTPIEEPWRKLQGKVEDLMMELMKKLEETKKIKGRRKRRKIRPVSLTVKMTEADEEIRKKTRKNRDLDQVADEDEVEVRKSRTAG